MKVLGVDIERPAHACVVIRAAGKVFYIDPFRLPEGSDMADVILTVLTLEITSIKNMRLFLEVADQLGYERSKLRIVMNRSDTTQGIRMGDVEGSIRRPIDGWRWSRD